VERAHRLHLVGIAAARRIAPQADDAHVEGLGETREAAPDISEADDEQCLAVELVLALREVADHLPPVAAVLVVARLGEAAGERQDQCHAVLGDGARVDAARAGEADQAALELAAWELVGAGADRLDEAQPRPAVEELTLPQAGNPQHVGLADAGCERLRIAYRKTPDAGAERRKALVEPVGDMRETD